MVGRKCDAVWPAAVNSSGGFTLLETLAVAAVIVVLAAIAVLPAYRSYQASRAAGDAAQTLAQDLSLAERVAQNGGPYQGATLYVLSASPFSYEVRRGRPAQLDPRSSLGDVVVRRSFAGVGLSGGPIDGQTPLLFADNGSAQFRAGGAWPDQHQTIELQLSPADHAENVVRVDLDLFSGAVSLP